ncbi:DoxX family protein [Chryseobacterium sp. GMJ5]|uniref:DoxX family protein n=1 Tax=Chryseobacterium gilvum TaxID=2976534 RepID=A0ABT2VUB7_9FLAO|nr:DoxX family protein [Chryseobacterium gilvum]MCU7613588.1 DoxX family protein [Chryseobacterium gilvum]
MSYINSKTHPVFTDVSLFIVRLFVGFAMLSHGFPKLQMLLEGGDIKFFDFLGLGPQISLALTVFAEFVCSIFLILGLFTRIAVGFLMFTMFVAAFFVHGGDTFDKREISLLYLSIYLLIMAIGSGRISVDGMIEKRKRASEW